MLYYVLVILEKLTDLRITEQVNPRSVNIDLISSLELVDLMSSEDALIAAAVSSQRETIAQAVDAAHTALETGGRIIYIGAGTSGRLGVLDASECPPTFGTSPEMVVGIIAGGEAALTVAQEGAEDDFEAARRDLDLIGLSANDFLIGIAASGTTPYVWSAIDFAVEQGCQTAFIACSPLPVDRRERVGIEIVPVVGPEVITGSTRLKAGTATKMVLNIISTGAMVRLGKTYRNVMVDLRATNQKLRDRSVRIVKEILDVSDASSVQLLEAAGGSVKTALVMGLLNCSTHEAVAHLASAGGVIRRIEAGRDESSAE